MKRVITYLIITVVSIAIWFAMKSELMNLVALGMMLVVGSAALGFLVRGKDRAAWSVLAVSSLLLVGGMVLSVVHVRREADSTAREFLLRHPCRPDTAELKSDSNWEVTSERAERSVSRFGAVRRMTYQSNGLFRYGFLHDKERTVWLPVCR